MTNLHRYEQLFKSEQLFELESAVRGPYRREIAENAAQPDEDMPPGPRDRTQRRRDRTRRQLIDAAAALISERGVDALRLRDLATTADIGLGSFYSHFASTEELVAAVVTESLQSFADALIVDIPDDVDPAHTASLSALRTVRIAYEDPELARLIVNLDQVTGSFATTMVPYVRIALQRGIDAGRFHVGAVDVTAILLAGGGLALIRAILNGTAPEHADIDHAETVLRFLGLTADEARHISKQSALDERNAQISRFEPGEFRAG